VVQCFFIRHHVNHDIYILKKRDADAKLIIGNCLRPICLRISEWNNNETKQPAFIRKLMNINYLLHNNRCL